MPGESASRELKQASPSPHSIWRVDCTPICLTIWVQSIFLEQDFHRKRKVQIPRKIFLIHNLRSANDAEMVIDIIGTIIYAFSAG